MVAPEHETAARPGAGTAVRTGRPAGVLAMSVLGKSHRFVCPRGNLNTETGAFPLDRGDRTTGIRERSPTVSTLPCSRQGLTLGPSRIHIGPRRLADWGPPATVVLTARP